jgi:Flp pilus assembly protein TadG
MRGKRETRKRFGSAIVEMAVVAPIFVFFIFGQIEAARLGMVAQLLVTAAREGCRVAVIDGKTNADVTAQITSDLSYAGISGVTTTQTPADCTTVHMGDSPNTVAITLSVPYTSVSWLPAPFFLKTATITATATLSSERP